MMEISPPHAQTHMQALCNAGTPLRVTDTAPGAHGSTVTGTHGIGVSTPRAAAVAEATSGLEGVLHIPKVGMLSIGAKCSIVAAGKPPAVTNEGGAAQLSTAGATP